MFSEGLTAVNSTEILDIMYADFQEKYEEYRRFIRERQAKEFSTKQKGNTTLQLTKVIFVTFMNNMHEVC